jgi:serine/threonine protein kinase
MTEETKSSTRSDVHDGPEAATGGNGAAGPDAGENTGQESPTTGTESPSSGRGFRSLAGSTVGQYAVGECLGEGGMGVVYRAEDRMLNRAVALKFPSDALKDSRNRERLLREARAASALTSPNIVAIYEIGEFEDAPFIAMEYVEGRRLSDVLKDGPLPLDQALDVIAQVAGALDSADAGGVIHRDIKSSNLVLMDSGIVKVLDFGIAKFMHQDVPAPEAGTSPITVSGNIFGTLSFMSPEQALGRTVDHRSDLFSLGVVFYQTLTGELPFAGASLNEVVDHIVHHEPTPVARFNHEVPREVEAVLRKMLEKDPNLRYQHAKEVQIDLQRIIRDRHPQDALSGPPAVTLTASLRSGASDLSPKRALVTDFRNLTSGCDDDRLGVSLTDAVTADLNSTLGFEVVGREAISELRKLVGTGIGEGPAAEDMLALEWARRARAGWLVTGAFQRFDDQVRITARLTDAREGTIVRTVKIDGDSDQVLALEDRIVRELTEGLDPTNGNDRESELAEARTEETVAVDSGRRANG